MGPFGFKLASILRGSDKPFAARAHTQKNDIEEKRKVANRWKIKVEDINCDGCLTKGPQVFRYCKICKIRKCGQEKQVENCAYCTEYPCETLSKIRDFKKDALDRIRASLKGKSARLNGQTSL